MQERNDGPKVLFWLVMVAMMFVLLSNTGILASFLHFWSHMLIV